MGDIMKYFSEVKKEKLSLKSYFEEIEVVNMVEDNT